MYPIRNLTGRRRRLTEISGYRQGTTNALWHRCKATGTDLNWVGIMITKEQLSAADSLDLRLLSGRIGAEVRGLHLTGDLPKETLVAIEAAVVRHKVIFFEAKGI